MASTVSATSCTRSNEAPFWAGWLLLTAKYENSTGRQAFDVPAHASQDSNIKLIEVASWLIREHEHPPSLQPELHACSIEQLAELFLHGQH